MWDGKQWMKPRSSPEVAAQVKEPAGMQNRTWRGLAEQPSA